jgi:hypothetical protein
MIPIAERCLIAIATVSLLYSGLISPIAQAQTRDVALALGAAMVEGRARQR